MDFACSAESDATAQVYVFFGPISGTTMAMDADAKMGDKSSASIAFGDALDAAGDTNGDGIDDLAVGAPDHGVAGGGAMLFLGPLVDSESGDAAAHWTSSTGSQPGAAIAGGGDVDGDGLSDWLIGDYGNDEVAESAGAAYLIYGGLTGSYDLEVAGAVFQGEQEKSWAGCSVDIGGDVDGDDHADLLIGAQGGPYVGLDDPGRAYLIFGGP